MTTNDDKEFENFLQSFQPLAPAPLVLPSRSRLFVPVLAAAAVALLVVGLFFLTKGAPRSTRLAEGRVANTMGGINHLAGGDPAKMDAILDSSARKSLPDVERSHGALRVLASE